MQLHCFCAKLSGKYAYYLMPNRTGLAKFPGQLQIDITPLSHSGTLLFYKQFAFDVGYRIFW